MSREVINHIVDIVIDILFGFSSGVCVVGGVKSIIIGNIRGVYTIPTLLCILACADCTWYWIKQVAEKLIRN